MRQHSSHRLLPWHPPFFWAIVLVAVAVGCPAGNGVGIWCRREYHKLLPWVCGALVVDRVAGRVVRRGPEANAPGCSCLVAGRGRLYAW